MRNFHQEELKLKRDTHASPAEKQNNHELMQQLLNWQQNHMAMDNKRYNPAMSHMQAGKTQQQQQQQSQAPLVVLNEPAKTK